MRHGAASAVGAAAITATVKKRPVNIDALVILSSWERLTRSLLRLIRNRNQICMCRLRSFCLSGLHVSASLFQLLRQPRRQIDGRRDPLVGTTSWDALARLLGPI